ncbi:hypothetical protein ACSQ67_007951 [Phaseolus vulgaris]
MQLKFIKGELEMTAQWQKVTPNSCSCIINQFFSTKCFIQDIIFSSSDNDKKSGKCDKYLSLVPDYTIVDMDFVALCVALNRFFYCLFTFI